MQVASVLEFYIDNDVYCFNTQLVSYVFDLEEYEKLSGLDEVVLGMVRYNDDVMFLIDTLKLYDEQKHIDLSTSKSVVVIKDEDGSLYGMVVDEIIKIEDVEVAPISLELSNEEITINHYKEKDRLVNEIVPLPLLRKKNIPSLQVQKEQRSLEQKNTTHEYLLFRIDQKLYGIKSLYIKEVVEKEGDLFDLDRKTIRFRGAITIRDEVVKVANIEYEEEAKEVIVVEKYAEEFAILADEVLDIEEFEVAKIERLAHSNNYIKAFYNLNQEVVAIVNVDYFLAKRERNKEQQKSQEQINSSKDSYLVFDFGLKEFSLAMEDVRQVFQTEDIAQNNSSIVSKNSSVAFITTWNDHAIEVIRLDDILDVTTNVEESQTIIIEHDGKLKGILVNNLDDILYVERSKVALSQTNSIINGAIIQDEKVIPKLSSERILEVA